MDVDHGMTLRALSNRCGTHRPLSLGRKLCRKLIGNSMFPASKMFPQEETVKPQC